jgi:hypothetical protein
MGFSETYAMVWVLLGLLSVLLVAVVLRVLRNQNILKALARAVGKGGFFPKVEIQKEGSLFLINLALVNSSDEDVWGEHCVVSLSDFEGVPSQGFEPTFKSVLVIREFAKARDKLRVGLCRTVYEAAGRPQDEYTFLISGTVQYRIGNAWYHQSFASRRVRMCGLQPIEVREDRRHAPNPGDCEPRLLEVAHD